MVLESQRIVVSQSTTITVEKATWKQLNRWKEPGESFDDVVSRLLEAEAPA